jgi:hypothetical protein
MLLLSAQVSFLWGVSCATPCMYRILLFFIFFFVIRRLIYQIARCVQHLTTFERYPLTNSMGQCQLMLEDNKKNNKNILYLLDLKIWGLKRCRFDLVYFIFLSHFPVTTKMKYYFADYRDT